MNYYLEVLKKYAVFKGRARRAEYWYFFLFNFIVTILLAVIDDSGTLYGIYGLGVIVPSVAVGVRRIHDIGKSGWWLFIAFIPIVGTILLILDLAKDSQSGDNKYGSNPKEQEEGNKSKGNIASQKYCNKCGKKIDIDSKFCTNCGTKIGS